MTSWKPIPVPAPPPCEPRRRPQARHVRRLFQGLAGLFPALLLSACGSLPFLGSGPQTNTEPPLPVVPKARRNAVGNQPPPQTPALAPLATPQQVVKAVSVGRPDPFGNVLKPTLILERGGASKTSAAAQRPAPPVLTWPAGLTFEGVLQTSDEREALVSVLPEGASEGARLAGSLRVGDTSASTDLLPPGWQVAAIDIEGERLVLRKAGQTVSRSLPKAPEL
ncbi:MAG: hypothetical protein RLZZ117_1438 [Cyanobacteriota bacterium]